MRWILATDAQRAGMVRADEAKQEATRRTAKYQTWLAGEIAELTAKRDAKQVELDNGGFARRLTRQIGDLDQEIAELQKSIR
jgi:hypothetical protein